MRLQVRIVVSTAALSMTALTPSHSATDTSAIGTRFSNSDRSQIELLACRTPHAVPMEQVTAHQPRSPDAGDRRTASLPITADVRCKSKADHAGNAVHFLASCNVLAGKWNCGNAGQSITMAVSGRQVTVASQTVIAGEMHDLMVKIGSFVVPLAAPGKPDGQTANCTISGDVSDPKVALLSINCNDWVVDVARLCPTASCRYEMGQRMYLPPRQQK